MLFATPAFAQTAGAAAAGGGLFDSGLVQFLPLLAIGAMFYFLMIRPQQKAVKEHKEMVSALKRGDTVVLSSGVIGKVAKVEETEVSVEIATGVVVKVERSRIDRVKSRTEPASANDSKSA